MKSPEHRAIRKSTTDKSGLQSQSTIDSIAEQILPRLVEDYRRLHTAPELSHHEKNTSAYISSQLRAMGYQVTEQFGHYTTGPWPCYGVVGFIQQGTGPCVLYRADMDALPIEEKTGLPYASRVRMNDDDGEEVPVMHACGHDLHCAVMIGIAEVMMQMKKHWRGTIMFVAQPGEESSDGAEAMLQAGLYDKFAKPDCALAIHAHDSSAVGQMKCTSGYAFAGVNSIDLFVRGIGGHGAYPEKCKDPIVLAAQIILALQTVISRGKSALDPAIITAGSIHGGTRRNIIPEEVLIELTVRTYKQSVKENILKAIERIAQGTAIAAGLPEDRYPIIKMGTSLAPVYNSPKLIEHCTRVLTSVLGADNVLVGKPTLGAEDFSCYAMDGQIPSAILWLGAIDANLIKSKLESGAIIPSIHSPLFQVMPEHALRTGVRAMTAVILDFLKK